MTFWCGSGSADPCLWLMDPDPDPAIFVIDLQDPNKKANLKKVFLLLLFEYTFTSFFKDKKSKWSHKTVGIKVFLTIFAWWWKEPDPDPYLWLMVPDPGGPKQTDPTDPDPQHWKIPYHSHSSSHSLCQVAQFVALFVCSYHLSLLSHVSLFPCFFPPFPIFPVLVFLRFIFSLLFPNFSAFSSFFAVFLLFRPFRCLFLFSRFSLFYFIFSCFLRILCNLITYLKQSSFF